MSSVTVAADSSTKRPASTVQQDLDDEEQQQQQSKQQEQAASTAIVPPQPKRRRVADSARVRAVRACQRCRRLKEKCDGRQPCQRCYRSGRDCEFAPVGVPASHSGGTAAASTTTTGGVAKTTTTTTTTTQHRPTQSNVINPREASLVVAETARAEERTKCLERLVQHLLGDVPLDLNNLRRMADKAGRRSESDNGSSTMGGPDELGDLTLEDENFTVKTLSQSTARESVYLPTTCGYTCLGRRVGSKSV